MTERTFEEIYSDAVYKFGNHVMPMEQARFIWSETLKGDGSESAGLRERLQKQFSDLLPELVTSTDSTICVCPQECRADVVKELVEAALVALAPAISRPPTQGSASPGSNENNTIFVARDGSEHSVPVDESKSQCSCVIGAFTKVTTVTTNMKDCPVHGPLLPAHLRPRPAAGGGPL